MEILFWITLAIVLYVYIGYPILLLTISLFYQKKVDKASITPTVTLIISAYNEEKSIKGKIENTLSLDYPKDRLEIIVVSDCSTDRTDDIVKGFYPQGVKLLRLEQRMGKTAGLNRAVKEASGEIIVFTDANAFYKKDALLKLVRNFNDPQIGCVTGESRYVENKNSPSAGCEGMYWNYENVIKYLESKVGSVVCGDGAIYAIRKELYQTLDNNDIADTLTPVQIVLKGFRNVYEPEAICFEEATQTFQDEFRRKVRISSRAWNSLMKIEGLLNPFRNGFFSIQVLSHRILRWLIPFFLIPLFLLNIPLMEKHIIYKIIFLSQTLIYLLAMIGFFLKDKIKGISLIYIPYYFVMVNAALFIGVLKGIQGNAPATWEHVRESSSTTKSSSLKLSQNPSLYIVFLFTLLFAITITQPLFTFWLSLLFILYVLFIYPLILNIWSFVIKSSGSQDRHNYAQLYPSVSLLIAAYNEEEIIEEKIKNSMSLDYPKDRLKIIIASDGSTDKTVDIVKKYISDRVQLFDYPERRGKISVLNRTVPRLDTEVVVFSDANTMYKADAILKLVRNFKDESIGVVSGNVKLVSEHVSFGEPERIYWNYEHKIQEKESLCNSMLEADGAMYAIRRHLFEPPSDNIILDDSVIPMNIAKKGYKIVYEPEAIGYEKTAPDLKAEFKRRVRITAGGIQALIQKEGIPELKDGALLFQYLSHKLFRWLMPYFLLALYISNILILNKHQFYLISFILQSVFYLLSIFGIIYDRSNFNLFTIPKYFVVSNTAMLIGTIKGLLNTQQVTWEKFKRA